MRALKLLHTDSRELNQVQLNARDVLNSVAQDLTSVPSASQIIKGVVFAGAFQDVTVTHALGRAPNGFFPVNLSQPVTLYKSPTSNANPNQTLILRSNSPVTADVLIF